jgi:RNA polymerase sigma-70 factor (ECF subfamily)
VSRGHDAGDVYRALAPAVLGYLRAQRVPEPEELLGEVFVQVARDLHRVRGDEQDVRRWVFKIARHRMIDDARARRRRPVTQPASVAPEAVAPEPAAALDPTLMDALDQLTADQREVVVLRFVADLSLEAAGTFQVTQYTANSDEPSSTGRRSRRPVVRAAAYPAQPSPPSYGWSSDRPPSQPTTVGRCPW